MSHNIMFLYACENGQTQKVKDLLEKAECNLQHTNYNGENGLMLAAGESHYEIVKILIETGEFDINARNGKKESILMIAASRGCVDTSCSILPIASPEGNEEGDNRDRRENRSRTFKIIIEEMIRQSQTLDIDKHSNHSTPALHENVFEVFKYACKEDHISQVKILIDTGLCDLGATDGYSSSFLVYARTPRIIHELIQRYTYSTEQIQKALWSSYRLGRPNVMTYLIYHLDAHAHRPHHNPLEVFRFQEGILPKIFDDLSAKKEEYAKIKDEVNALLSISDGERDRKVKK